MKEAPPHEVLLLLSLWFLAVPPAAALISDDIVEEKIGQSFTAWIDRKFRGSLVAYLFRCPRCLSHWVVFVFWVTYIPVWATLPISLYARSVTALLSLAAAIRFTRMWLKQHD